jgi:hypothetical protein
MDQSNQVGSLLLWLVEINKPRKVCTGPTRTHQSAVGLLGYVRIGASLPLDRLHLSNLGYRLVVPQLYCFKVHTLLTPTLLAEELRELHLTFA